MKRSIFKILLVFFVFYSAGINAQDQPVSLKNINKLMLNMNWRGDVSPYDIGVNADSLFDYFSFYLNEFYIGDVIDGRGINNNTQKIPLLLFDVQIQTFLEKYIFYFVSVGLFEGVQIERLENKTFTAITLISQDYNVFEKDTAAENLIRSLDNQLTSFAQTYDKDKYSE